MIKYKLEDGGVISAKNATEAVFQLRTGSRFDSECSDDAYMENFAYRYKIQSGKIVRYDCPENFVKDLTDLGYMKIVED